MTLVSALSLFRDPGVQEALGVLYERYPREYVSMLPVAVEAMGMIGPITARGDVKTVVLRMLTVSLRSSHAAKYAEQSAEDLVADHLNVLAQALRNALDRVEPERIRWALDPIAQQEHAQAFTTAVEAVFSAEDSDGHSGQHASAE